MVVIDKVFDSLWHKAGWVNLLKLSKYKLFS